MKLNLFGVLAVAVLIAIVWAISESDDPLPAPTLQTAHPVHQAHRLWHLEPAAQPVKHEPAAPHVLPASEIVESLSARAGEIVPALTSLNVAVPESAEDTYLGYAKAALVQLAELAGRPVPDDLDERALWLVTWFALEEPAGKGAAFNPANTTLKTDHVVSSFNSVGVRNYDSFDHGVDAFVRTLWVGGHARGDTSAAGGHDAYGYGALVKIVLNPDATFAEYAQAVRASSWCSGCYGPLPDPESHGISNYAAQEVPGKD